MNREYCRTSGFTLIELMIVIAVVAILVALAVPAYKDFTVRAKVAECIAGAAVPKVQISEFQQSTTRWPETANQAGIDEMGLSLGANLSQYCGYHFYNSRVNSPATPSRYGGDFAVHVDAETIDSRLTGQLIRPVFSPVLNDSGGADWYCTVGFTEASAVKFLPTNCRDDNIWQLPDPRG